MHSNGTDTSRRELRDLVEQMRMMNRVHSALSSSLDNEELHTLILATLTTPSGLNYQRAFLFLYDAETETLRGSMAMGPASVTAAHKIAEEYEAEQRMLEQMEISLREDDETGGGTESDQAMNDSLRNLRQGAYWISVLQNYAPNNPLTRKVTTIEQKRDVVPPSSNGTNKKRLIDFVTKKRPFIRKKEDLNLSSTMKALLGDQIILLPLFTVRSPYGLVVLDNKFAEGELHLGTQELEYLIWYIDQTALALENARLFGELQSSYHGLLEVEQMKNNFLSTVSHELRTPLTVINGFVDILLKGSAGDLQESQQNLLRRVQNQGQHLTNIVNDLIEVAQVQSGAFRDVDIESVDPLTCLMNVLPRLDPRKQGRNISIDFDATSDVPLVKANAKVLERIYYHLLDNAVKFIEDEGAVEITFTREESHLRIGIKDNGIGIDPERQREIFDSFYQVNDNLDRDYNGLGIGLSVTKFLLESTRGTIDLTSTPGVGSTFTVRYPISNQQIDSRSRLGRM